MNKITILAGLFIIGVFSITASACPCPPLPPCYHQTSGPPTCGSAYCSGGTICCGGGCITCSGSCCNGSCCSSAECKSCVDGSCVSSCDPANCESCVGGSCVSSCDPANCESCVGGSCESSCDPLYCEFCVGGSCVSDCDPAACESCVGGFCLSDCDPLSCESCDGGSCISDCDPDACESCDGGSCVSDCDPAACESCDSFWGYCASDCDQSACESCAGGSCVSNCDPANCESCIGGSCVSSCSTAACESCVGGSCVSSCDPADCESCVGSSCVSNCSTANCQHCNGSGSCVTNCSTANCEHCNGSGSCVTNCSTANCEHCNGSGSCVSNCDSGDCEVCNGSGSCESTCTICQNCNSGTCVPKPNTCDNCDNHGAGCSKIPGTYCRGNILAAGDITSPSDNSHYRPGNSITFSAASGNDSDCYYYTSANGCFTCSSSQSDTVTVSWTAVWQGTSNPAGTFPSGNTGTSVQWQAPSSYGKVVITATWNDDGSPYYYNDGSENESVTIILDPRIIAVFSGQDAIIGTRHLHLSLHDEDWAQSPSNIVGMFEEDADWWPPYGNARDWIRGYKQDWPEAPVIIVGHSNGSDGGRKVADYLSGDGIDVELLYLFDLVPKPWECGDPKYKPAKPITNVSSCVNLYQRDDVRTFWWLLCLGDVYMQGWFASPASQTLWHTTNTQPQPSTIQKTYYIDNDPYQIDVYPHTEMIFDETNKNDLKDEIEAY